MNWTLLIRRRNVVDNVYVLDDGIETWNFITHSQVCWGFSHSGAYEEYYLLVCDTM
jgi:hypothetical protein